MVAQKAGPPTPHLGSRHPRGGGDIIRGAQELCRCSSASGSCVRLNSTTLVGEAGLESRLLLTGPQARPELPGEGSTPIASWRKAGRGRAGALLVFLTHPGTWIDPACVLHGTPRGSHRRHGITSRTVSLRKRSSLGKGPYQPQKAKKPLNYAAATTWQSFLGYGQRQSLF